MWWWILALRTKELASHVKELAYHVGKARVQTSWEPERTVGRGCIIACFFFCVQRIRPASQQRWLLDLRM